MSTRLTQLAIVMLTFGACGQNTVDVDNLDSTSAETVNIRRQTLSNSYCSANLPWGVCSRECTEPCIQLYCQNTNAMGPACGTVSSWHYEAQWLRPGTYGDDLGGASFSCNVVCNKCTACDFSGDKKVQFDDFLILAENWKKSVTRYTRGDCTGNGRVDEADLVQLRKYFDLSRCPSGGNDAPGI